MENMTGKVERMASRNAKRRLWQRFVAIPAAIVVFITTYALILPAIAMEKDTYCGLEAHTHSDECYTAQLACGYEDGAVVESTQTVTALACTASAHQHTEECFDEFGSVICGFADYLVHTHTAECYNALGELVCPLPEVEAHTHDESCYVEELVNVCGQAEGEGHTHTDACYTVVSHPEMICGQAESAGHVHDENCYTPVEHTYLVCGQAESEGHIHGEGCWTTTVLEDGTEVTELTCGQAESAGHVHTDACYVTETTLELTCGLAETPGHTHTEACFVNVEELELTCGLPETPAHTHTDACYVTEKRLVCEKPEVILHTHSEDCYTTTVLEDGTELTELTCTQPVVEEHVHDDQCFTTYEETVQRTHQHTDLCYIQVLTCTLPEHVHTDACYEKPEEPETSAEPEATAEPEIVELADDMMLGLPVEIAGTETAAPEYICGMEEHTHDESCYTVTVAEDGSEITELICEKPEHIHGETCLAPVEIIEDEPETDVEIVEEETPHFQLPVLVCGMEEHEHSTNCMDENMVYACGIAPHTHSGACYAIPDMDGVSPILVCDKHEHFHTEACYSEAGELICGVEAHTHDVACFALPEGVEDPETIPAPEVTYYCGFVAHAHSEACLDANGVAVCGLPEHEHTDECLLEPTWYCGKTEHTHDETCLDEAGELVCGLEEHTHSAVCLVEPTWYCGKTEHTHDESCLNENGELVCGLEEHIHTADCRVEHFTQIAMAEGVMVTAKYTSEAGFPADAMLQVVRFSDGEHYEARVNEAENVFYAENPDQIFQPRALLNIGFYLPDGTEVEPIAPVDVTVQMLDENGLAEGEQYTVIHYGAAGTELLDAEHTESTVNFSAESFSDFIIGDDEDPSDGGSNVADNGDGEEETVPPIRWGETLPNWLVGSFSQSSSSSGEPFMLISGTGSAVVPFEHNKTIDYLGDNQDDTGVVADNPDTTVDNTNDKTDVTDDLYRLYLDMEGASEPVDLLIVLDRSGSMFYTVKRQNEVGTILFGSTGSTVTPDSLIGRFLAPNANAASEADMNYVSMVWYGGRRAFTDDTNYTRRGKENTPPDADTEGGVSFYWANSTAEINYNFNSMVSGGASHINDASRRKETATNYVAGYVQADKMLNDTDHHGTARTGHKQVVIFITDGVPTLYYEPDEFEKAWANGSFSSMTRYGYGTDEFTIQDFDGNNKPLGEILIWPYAKAASAAEGNPLYTTHALYGGSGKYYTNSGVSGIIYNCLTKIYHSPYYAKTAQCFQSFRDRHPNINFFALGIDMNSAVSTIDGSWFNDGSKYWVLDTMVQMYYAEGKAIRTGVNEDTTLKEALEQIMFPSGVVITDPLSTYVDLYGKEPDIKVTATPKAGGDPITLWEYTGSVSGAGNISGQYKDALEGVPATSIIQSVNFDGNKTVTLTFQPSYRLSVNYTYTISFNVKLTQQAYDDFATKMNQNGGVPKDSYSDTGDDDTDYGGNATSSNAPGFFSNNGAKVSYKVDGATKELPYDDPVVQCWGTKFQFKKVAPDKPDGKDGIPFQLRWKKPGSYDWTIWNIAKDSNGYPAQKASDTDWYLTDADGVIDFGYLPSGDYELWEDVPKEYKSDGVGLEQSGAQVKWMTFTVEKGRIIKVNVTAKGVTWTGDEESNHTSYDFNSIPNTPYESGKAVLTVENQSYDQPLHIVKKDEAGAALKDAWFQLSLDKDRNQETKGDLVAFGEDELTKFLGDYASLIKTEGENAYLVSNDMGLVFSGRLPYGLYRLVEYKAPANYERLDETKEIYFSVDQDDIKLEPNEGPYEGFAKLEKTADGTAFVLTVTDARIQVDWKLKKVGLDSVPLAGATFELYGPYDAAQDPFEPNGDKLSYTGTTVEGGLFPEMEGQKLPKLEAGKYYYLVETEAPAGYNKLEGAIQLHPEEKPDVSGGKELVLNVAHGTQTETIKPVDEGDPTVYTVTVTNNTGYELPESGGVGTTVFYMGGLALMALAGAMLCARKRRSCG